MWHSISGKKKTIDVVLMNILSTTRIFIYHLGFSNHEAEAENTIYTFVLVV